VAELVAGALVTPNLRLVRSLGQGGMGRVWIADHLALRTQVVVKFMSEELAQSDEALARFSREAAAASQVKSPHVVHMIDFGVAQNGLPYIAMELLEGKDLSQLIARYGVLSPEGVSRIVTQVGRALTRAHEKGIIHRDIKPENIFLIDAGGGEIFAKVLDFGVAKAALADSVRTTGTGMMIGTPLYMSPEQVLGEKTVDHRSDLWSLGVVAFEAMTGGVPFSGETVGAISVAICHKEMPRPSERNHEIGPEVDAWFLRACARDLGARFRTAKEMGEALAWAVQADAAERSGAARPLKPAAPAEEAGPTAAQPPPGTMMEVLEETKLWQGPGPQQTPAEPVHLEQLASPERRDLNPPPAIAAASRVGQATTNGATSRNALSPAASALATQHRRQQLALVGAVGGAAVVVALIAIIVIAVWPRSNASEETPRRRARHAEAANASAAETTTPPEAESVEELSPSASASSVASSAASEPPAPIPPPPAPTPSTWIAPKATNVPKPTAGAPSATAKPKPKGKNVVIE
jgi:serine/threonine-protein kinase